MSSLIFYVVLNLFFIVNSISLDDLESIFDDKHCIEASLIPVTLDQQGESQMFETDSPVQASVLKDTMKTVTAKIHELSQYHNMELVYKLISEDGPPHSKTFKVGLILGDESHEGSGSSLNKAKQAAAAVALENTFYEHPPKGLDVKKEKNQTPTVILNNIATKLGVAVSYYLLNGELEQTIDSYGSYDQSYGKSKNYFKINSTSSQLRVPVEEEQISGPFTIRVKVGSLLFKGIGHTIQAARHDAALNALKMMEQQILFKDGVCNQEESVRECKEKKDNLKSPISRIHEFAQKRNLPVEFNVISETGKSHKKVFVTQCKVDGLVTEGEAASKKEAKRIAAEEMLKILPQLPEEYNENAIINNFSDKKKKRKKKTIVKDSVNNFMNSVSNIASVIWGSDDNSLSKVQKFKPGTRSHPKDKMLELGGKLNINIDFTDLNKQGDQFLSLMNLGIKPPHICLGKAATRDSSHDVAALYGMKFLQKSGIFENVEFKQYDLSADIESYELEEEVEEYKSVTEMKKETIMP